MAHISMEPCAVDGSSNATVVLGRTCELAGEVGVVGFGGGDVSSQQLWRQRLGAVRGRGRTALLVHRQHMRRQPPVLLPGRCEFMTYFSFLIFILIPISPEVDVQSWTHPASIPYHIYEIQPFCWTKQIRGMMRVELAWQDMQTEASGSFIT